MSDIPESLLDSALSVVMDHARTLWDTDFALVVRPQPDNTGYRASVILGGEIEVGVAADADAVAAVSLSLHRAVTNFEDALAEEEASTGVEDD